MQQCGKERKGAMGVSSLLHSLSTQFRNAHARPGQSVGVFLCGGPFVWLNASKQGHYTQCYET